MKRTRIAILLFIPSVLFGFGVLYGNLNSVSYAKFSLLDHRLALVEESSTFNASEQRQLPEGFQSKLYQVDEQQRQLQAYVHARIKELEQEMEAYKSRKVDRENQKVKEESLNLNNEQLQLSIESLDQAASSGVLDKVTQKGLDERVKVMDEKNQEIYWQRMFADLQQGRYDLPTHDDELPEVYQLPDEEVNGEI